MKRHGLARNLKEVKVQKIGKETAKSENIFETRA